MQNLQQNFFRAILGPFTVRSNPVLVSVRGMKKLAVRSISYKFISGLSVLKNVFMKSTIKKFYLQNICITSFP